MYWYLGSKFSRITFFPPSNTQVSHFKKVQSVHLCPRMPGDYSVEGGQISNSKAGRNGLAPVLLLLPLLRWPWAPSGQTCSFPGAASSQSPAPAPTGWWQLWAHGHRTSITIQEPQLLWQVLLPAKATDFQTKPALTQPISPLLRTWIIKLNISCPLIFRIFHLCKCVCLCPSWGSLLGRPYKTPQVD